MAEFISEVGYLDYFNSITEWIKCTSNNSLDLMQGLGKIVLDLMFKVDRKLFYVVKWLWTMCDFWEVYYILDRIRRYELSPERKQPCDVVDVVISDVINDARHPGTEAESSLKQIRYRRAMLKRYTDELLPTGYMHQSQLIPKNTTEQSCMFLPPAQRRV